jgi:hypothetical protein
VKGSVVKGGVVKGERRAGVKRGGVTGVMDVGVNGKERRNEG